MPSGAVVGSLPKAADDVLDFFPDRILVAANWDLLEADFVAGTALGLGKQRAAIEVLWSDVERWAEPLVIVERQAQKLQQVVEASTYSVSEVQIAPTVRRELEAKVSPATTSGVSLGKKRGKPPSKIEGIISKMVADYSRDPERLQREKTVTLLALYGSSNGTINRAQHAAIARIKSGFFITDR